MSDSEDQPHDSASEYGGKTRKKVAARGGGRRASGGGRTPSSSSTTGNVSVLGRIPEIAKVDVAATDSGGVADVAEEDDKLSKVNSDVLKRIQSALALAQHPNTGVAEAHNAMRVASRLMAKENITQADLIARETEAEKSKRAGMSTVDIVPNPDYKLGRKRGAAAAAAEDDDDDFKIIQNKSWHGMCVDAMQTFFNVKAYSTSYGNQPKLTWTFYGIAENTTAAAYALEMVHNTIMTWSYENKRLKGRVAYNSYREGVARGLVEIAHKEKEEEGRKASENEKRLIAERVKREEEERTREIERLEGPSRVKEEPMDDAPIPSCSGTRVKLEEVDDADNARRPQPTRVKSESPAPTLLNNGGDDDADMSGGEVEDIVAADFHDDDPIDEDWRPQDPNAGIDWVPFDARPKEEEPMEPKIEPKAEPAEAAAGEGWQSSAQLVRFRNDAETIADNYLKSQRIKVSTARARSRNKRDVRAYAEGKEDSKKIDVKRRRLENAV